MSALAGGGDGSLPPVIELRNPEIAYDVWVLWIATGRRFLPSQLLTEPVSLLDDMLLLDGIYGTITERAREQTQNGR